MYVLLLYTIITTSSGNFGSVKSDWRAISEFTSKPTCEAAIKEMKLTPDRALCLQK